MFYLFINTCIFSTRKQYVIHFSNLWTVKHDISSSLIKDDEGYKRQDVFMYMNQPNLIPLLFFFHHRSMYKIPFGYSYEDY